MTNPISASRARRRRIPFAIISLFLASAIAGPLGPKSASSLVRPSRESERNALWARIYADLPEPWKSKRVVVVREVSDREMDRLVREHEEDERHRSQDDEDTVQAFFEYAGPNENVPTIVIRQSLTQDEASFVFTHEYGHFVWEEKLSDSDRDDYFRLWNRLRRERRLVSDYAADSVVEGFAEALAHRLRRPTRLHRRDPDSEQFLLDWLDDHRPPTPSAN